MGTTLMHLDVDLQENKIYIGKVNGEGISGIKEIGK